MKSVLFRIIGKCLFAQEEHLLVYFIAIFRCHFGNEIPPPLGHSEGGVFTERQKTSLSAPETVTDKLGLQIYVFESKVDENGKRIGKMAGTIPMTEASILICTPARCFFLMTQATP